MSNLDENKIFNEDYIILKQKFQNLDFINGVAIYYDSSATKRRISQGSENKWENNYGVITSDGFFLKDKIAKYFDRFYNQIAITSYGLFKLTRKDHNIYSEDKIAYHTYIFDCEGNYLCEDDFDTLLLILSNRNICYSPEKFIEMIPDLEKCTFKIVGNTSNIWREKDGEYKLEFNKEREDGLHFYTEDLMRSSSDSYTEFQYVRDKMWNKMHLNDFYHGLLMLNNGKKYLSELSNKYLENQLEKFKKQIM
jgi:hypothetical protein